jgi:hypothetical protein
VIVGLAPGLGLCTCSGLSQDAEALRVVVGGGGVEGGPAPRISGVEAIQLIAVQQVLQQLGVVPQRRLVQQPSNKKPRVNTPYSQSYVLDLM